MIKICPICNNEFEARDNRKIYCSDQCRQRGHYLRNIKPRYKKMDSLDYPIKKCIICGKNFQLKSPYANKRQCCYNCMPEGYQWTRGDFLSTIKEKMGGGCFRCGYHKCLKAIEFHHLDPSKKRFYYK